MKEKLKDKTGKEYWRSLEQLSGSEEFKQFLHREFPEGASEMDNKWSRRNFLTMMGASMALAGLASCRRPEEKIVPYVRAPEEILPGRPLFYATNMPLGDSSVGLVVETHEGRPTKIEGNKLHPSSGGALNSMIQASVLGLYDPDRSQSVTSGRDKKEWADFAAFWVEHAATFEENQGEGLAVVTEPYASPTLNRLFSEFGKKYPKAKWIGYAPVTDENVYSGIKVASGKDHRPIYDYSAAKVILSLDSDFTLTESENIISSRGFADGRRVKSEKDEMNRLYQIESGHSSTGGNADHRLRLQSGQIPAFALTLAFALQDEGLKIEALKSVTRPSVPAGDSEWQRWLKPLAQDLMKAGKQSLVVAGYRQPSELHALVYAINHALESQAVSYVDFSDSLLSDSGQFADFTNEIHEGKYNTLILMGCNPVYDAPSDLKFASALKKAATTVHLGLYRDETGAACQWHLPMSHYLEQWGDVRSADGTRGLVQPMIEPLYGGHSSVELLSLITNGVESRGYELVRQTWSKLLSGDIFEKHWKKILHDGLQDGSAGKLRDSKVKSGAVSKACTAKLFTAETFNSMEIVFAVSPSLYDGRYANNGWLMELPDPVTKISWDNAALMSPATASQLGIESKEIVRLAINGREIEAPAWILPGQADNSIMIELGYGRSGVGRIGNEIGANAYKLRTWESQHFAYGLTISKTGRNMAIANVQDHSSMEGRPLVREASLEEYRRDPEFAPEMVQHPPLVSMWNEHKYDQGYQWGMTIDLNVCNGCNACTVACQSENNIPVIGKAEVEKGREMHWIRIDRYFAGDENDPEMVYQPVTCQHCEDAPCEQVCPVAATSHNKEGLNVMTYNRCIGTRYCSNNCPYKVRRFNFFNFTKDTPEVVKMAMNPDVTVRSRGVMEKCTFCVQRINGARLEAQKADREIQDGEITTACQQTCPANAIEFGNILDKESRVAKAKEQNRNYAMLSELNTKPRLTYLAKIRNPNPELS
ncbi:MAG: TAT-variant-translocated molybdopterin oxidoreductase [bacterium]|nr:TAT-variant-translocated molybdopterin oxidoreductase [bacterium]